MSNEVTIEQMNEVIARFDGWETHFYNDTLFFRKEGKSYFNSDLKYHTSWDWLMDVVEKIEMLKNTVRIYSGHTTICTDTGYPVCQILEKSKIKATHIAVYQFITWYNQQKQNNEQ